VAALAGIGDGQEERGSTVALSGPGNGSFESFVSRHSSRLVQSLSLIVLDQELAADAAQDAFLQLHLHWEDMGKIQDPVAWLYRVAINRSHDYRRRLVRSARLLERLVSSSSSADWAAPDAITTDFASVFRGLPARQRTAATLYYLADFSVAEIARVMSVSDGTVNRHLYRARENLRRTLEVE